MKPLAGGSALPNCCTTCPLSNARYTGLVVLLCYFQPWSLLPKGCCKLQVSTWIQGPPGTPSQLRWLVRGTAPSIWT